MVSIPLSLPGIADNAPTISVHCYRGNFRITGMSFAVGARKIMYSERSYLPQRNFFIDRSRISAQRLRGIVSLSEFAA